MTENKFKTYLKRRQSSDDLDRRIVNSMKTDPDLPDPASRVHLELYLTQRETTQDEIKAAKYVWELYEKKRQAMLNSPIHPVLMVIAVLLGACSTTVYEIGDHVCEAECMSIYPNEVEGYTDRSTLERYF